MSGNNNQLGFATNFVISGTSAVIGTIPAAPLQRIKFLLQCQHENIYGGRLSEPYRGIFNCTVRTFKREGFLSFWRGNLADCLRFPTRYLDFAFKDAIKTLFTDDPKESLGVKLSKNIFVGGAAGVQSLFVVYPLDYARTRLANDVNVTNKGGQRQFSGVIDVYKKTLASDGVQGIYRGFVISCVGAGAYRGFYFGLYDTMKPIFVQGNHNMFLNFILGYSVTLTSTLLAYPFDTIRRRMMMRSIEAVKYKGSIDCARYVIKNEGFMAFMKGSGVVILQSVVGAAMLIGYDILKAL